MKKTYAQIKDRARGNLLGNYTTPMAASVIVILLSTFLKAPFSQMLNSAVESQLFYKMPVGIAGSIIVSIVCYVLSVGVDKIHLNLARKSRHQLSDMIYPFKHYPDKYLLFSLVIIGISLACELPGLIGYILNIGILSSDSSINISGMLISTLILVIGVVIAVILLLGLRMTSYLLLDHPEWKLGHAMKISRTYMDGNKRRLFLLYLSFIGWYILGVLSCFIAFLWIMPYTRQSSALFYLDLISTPAGQETENPDN